MDLARFDQISKRVATWRLSRRRAVRGLGAAATVGALLALRREEAAADCSDISICAYACGGPEGLHDVCTFPIPGGARGACWGWDTLRCNPCHTTWAELNALCAGSALCGGRCTAYFGAP